MNHHLRADSVCCCRSIHISVPKYVCRDGMDHHLRADSDSHAGDSLSCIKNDFSDGEEGLMEQLGDLFEIDAVSFVERVEFGTINVEYSSHFTLCVVEGHYNLAPRS